MKQTFELLIETYKPKATSTALEHRTFDLITLQKWHSIAFKGHSYEEYAPGQFRKKGLLAQDPYPHQYPHHNIVVPALQQLCTLVHQCAKRISKRFVIPSSITLYTVCLAAFAQFHFVDIHPFLDGNGRICRLISKVIMDHIFPLPIPMFKNRDAYIRTLVEGRKSEVIYDAPLKLASLLFDEAIAFYTAENRAMEIANYFFCSITEDGLQSQIDIDGLEEHSKEIVDKFRSMSDVEDNSDMVYLQDNEKGQVVVSIRRLPEVDFDDL